MTAVVGLVYPPGKGGMGMLSQSRIAGNSFLGILEYGR